MSAEADTAAWAPLVEQELRDPTGSVVLVAQIAVGDLSDQGALNALRRGIASLEVKAPDVGA